MTPTNLDHALEKYLKLQLTRVESSRVDLWLKIMRKKSYRGADIGRNDEEKLARMIFKDHEGVITEFVPKYANVSYTQGKTLFMVILSMILCLVTYLYYTDDAQEHLSSFENPVKRVFLQDGTIVFTSSDSKLAYAESDDRRRIVFNGEGLFEVSKSYAPPLRLYFKNMVVKISGACFVQTVGLGFKVQVLDGIARVQSSQTTRDVTAEKDEQLELKSDGILIVSKGALDIPAIYLSRYLMKFEWADSWDIVLRIQRKFGVTILTDNLESTKISGDFTGRSLLETLDLLSKQLGLEYSIDGDIVKLIDKVGAAPKIH